MMFIRLSIIETNPARQGEPRGFMVRADHVIAVSEITVDAPDFPKLHGKTYSHVTFNVGSEMQSVTVLDTLKEIEELISVNVASYGMKE